jgi:hypothetical protein
VGALVITERTCSNPRVRLARTASALAILATCAFIVGGCHKLAHPELPDPDVDPGLGNFVLMTFTTRAPEGILGHALEAGAHPGGNLDPQRKPIAGTPKEVPTAQHLRIVMRVEDQLSVAAKYGPVKAGAQASRATHVAYDVELTGYLEYFPEQLKYDPACGCCVGGGLSDACGAFYVTRLFRGTGATQLLTEVTGSGAVDAADVLHASGGRAFRSLSESTFQDAYFAYEFAHLDALCQKLDPEQEMPPLEVDAQKNCFLTTYSSHGQRLQVSWALPDKELCTLVLKKACAEQVEAVRCEGRFRKASPSAGVPPTTGRASPAPASPATSESEVMEVISLEAPASVPSAPAAASPVVP